MSTTIRVGEHTFLTDPATQIGESKFFKSLFSKEQNTRNHDGQSYFVDADHDVFVIYYAEYCHILYGALALTEEARFFGIEKLENWLNERKYFGSHQNHL
jgi:hypothetical protein